MYWLYSWYRASTSCTYWWLLATFGRFLPLGHFHFLFPLLCLPVLKTGPRVAWICALTRSVEAHPLSVLTAANQPLPIVVVLLLTELFSDNRPIICLLFLLKMLLASTDQPLPKLLTTSLRHDPGVLCTPHFPTPPRNSSLLWYQCSLVEPHLLLNLLSCSIRIVKTRDMTKPYQQWALSLRPIAWLLLIFLS